SVGCFLCRYGNIAFLSDPFWSHLSFWHVAFGKTVPKPELVDPYLPEIRDVSAIFVCHSHYDHDLDLSYIAPHLPKETTIFGSQTLANTFAPYGLDQRFVQVNSDMATQNDMGNRLYASKGRLRILPILSGHPNQYLFFHLFQERIKKPRKRIPQRSWDFQEGETIAFLIDILDEAQEKIEKRIYLQTSTTGFPIGSFPQSILDEHPVDVALLGIDCANIKAEGKPSIIDFLQPKVVIFSHWEDFFQPKQDPPHEIVKVDLYALKEALPSTPSCKMIFPYWDSTFLL
ncbi:MAG: hypothetical protein VX278_01170, partial [Myxococcota bacterium]|nr:hypothetical protein [Myxococcota bacterium]